MGNDDGGNVALIQLLDGITQRISAPKDLDARALLIKDLTNSHKRTSLIPAIAPCLPTSRSVAQNEAFEKSAMATIAFEAAPFAAPDASTTADIEGSSMIVLR
jgi:hypothetical protein